MACLLIFATENNLSSGGVVKGRVEIGNIYKDHCSGTVLSMHFLTKISQ